MENMNRMYMLTRSEASPMALVFVNWKCAILDTGNRNKIAHAAPLMAAAPLCL